MTTDMTLLSKQERSALMITRIRMLLKEQQLSDAALAQKINIPQATISRLLSGATEDPRISTLAAIADAVDSTVGFLIDPKHRVATPIIKWTQIPAFISGEFDDSQHFDWVFSSRSLSKKSFALVAPKNWEPRYRADSILIIEPTSTLYNSQTAVFLDNRESPLILNVVQSDREILFSEINSNAIYRLSKDVKSFKLLGVVTESRFPKHD